MDSKSKVCCVCNHVIKTLSSRLECETCKSSHHIACLSTPLPTSLLGDNFFTLCCKSCSSAKMEIVKRDKVNWLTALVVAIYNLKQLNPEMSRDGYFHWKLHVATFLEQNWACLFGPQMKKRKTWLGTISGTMSHWSGVIFRSGLSSLKESGWWKLMKELPPEDLISSVPSSINRNVMSHSKTEHPPIASKPVVTEPERKRTRGVQSSIAKAMALKEKRSSMTGTSGSSHSKPIEKPATKRARPSSPKNSKHWFMEVQESKSPPLMLFNEDNAVDMFDDPLYLPQECGGVDESIDDCSIDEMVSASRDSFPSVEDLVSRLTSVESPSVTPLSTAPATPSGGRRSPLSSHTSSVLSFEDVVNMDDDKSLIELEKSDKENTKVSKETVKTSKPKKIALPVEDEEEILKLLEDKISVIESKEIHHFKRKLEMRKARRMRGLKVSVMDRNEVEVLRIREAIAKVEVPSPKKPIDNRPRILDRYQLVLTGTTEDAFKGCSFRTRLLGRDHVDMKPIKSPYTGRMLKPFIRRDYKTEPLKLKLLREITRKANPDAVIERHPIDYMYVRPNHIPSVNHLARGFFWPGIDLSECLQFPDFSCVAVYKKIVIGFAFLVPDVSYVDAYVSFIFTHPEWRKVGIAKFMLYHLIQTCMGKDITLHVSATNPAIFLYQKFGFKVEEYINNFYDKYLPPESKHCKHALFLRLSR